MTLFLNVMYTEEADAWTWKSRPEKLAMEEAEACTTTPTRDLRPRNKMINPLTEDIREVGDVVGWGLHHHTNSGPEAKEQDG